jgi:hypothetical protein
MFASLPLLGLPVLVYTLFALTFPGGTADIPETHMAQVLFSIEMASKVSWPVHVGDLFVFASIVILFVELLKSTQSGRVAIINHSLSMLLFIGCLVAFLLVRNFATSSFFLITSMVLLDVLAGFVVSIASARREIDVIR